MSITQRHRRTHPYRQVLGRASLRTWSSADPLVTSFSGTMLYRAAETETGPGPDETWNDGCGSDGGGTSEASPHLRRSTRPFGGVTGCPATCGYDLAIGRGHRCRRRVLAHEQACALDAVRVQPCRPRDWIVGLTG